MRLWFLLLCAPLVAGAQFPPAQAVGTLLERDTNPAAGEFAIRAPDFQVYRFQFDTKTAVERDTFFGGVTWLKTGDQLSVESRPVAGSLLHYAVTVHVLHSKAQASLADSRLQSSELFPFPQTVTLTFAGVVSKLDSQSLVLRTRTGQQTLLIRGDTRYVANGDTVEARDLRPNMRVYIRAGRNLYEQVEAYQVIWGDILDRPQQ